MILTETDFTRQINDLDINDIGSYFGLEESYFLDYHGVADIDFAITPEIREWGIKSIDVWIKRIHVQIEWRCWGDEITVEQKAALLSKGGSEFINGEISGIFYIDSATDYWEIDNSVEFGEYGNMTIENISIDFEERSITVS